MSQSKKNVFFYTDHYSTPKLSFYAILPDPNPPLNITEENKAIITNEAVSLIQCPLLVWFINRVDN